jgi:large subunit ribosomal protein L23
MRNHTPIGEPYDPYVATFRIPQSMTKHDLRSYLSAVYGLNVTFIRTDNYVADVQRLGTAGQLRRKAGSTKTYKRAVVGLHEPFQYPDDMEELDAVISAVDHPPTEGYENQSHEDRVLAAELAKQGKEKRQDWLETNFMMDLQASGRKRSMMKMANGWRWRAGTSDNKVRPGVPVATCQMAGYFWHAHPHFFAYFQGNVVREIMKRRMDREKAIVDALEKLQLNNEATTAVTAQPSVAA